MRIGICTAMFPVLSETPFLNQVSGLVERGHDVEVFATRPQPDAPFFHPDVERLGLVERVRYPEPLPKGGAARLAKVREILGRYEGKPRRALLRTLNPLVYWKRATSLEQLSRTARFFDATPHDVYYFPYGQDAVQGLRVQRVGGIRGPMVTAFRGADITKYVRKRGGRIYGRLFRLGDLFLPVSESFVPKLVALGAPSDRIVVHGTGISLTRFPFVARRPEPTGTLRVVTVARLVEKKGIDVALHAVRALVSAGVDVRYEVLGDGPLRAQLDALVVSLGLQGHATLLGWQSQTEVVAALERAHVLLAPSFTARSADEEGIPNVLKEAMATGLPVVSTHHSGIPELVEDGVSGFLVAERDVGAVVERLRFLATHPEQWGALGAAGRKRIERDFDIERLNDRLVGLFEQARRAPRVGGAALGGSIHG